VLNISKY